MNMDKLFGKRNETNNEAFAIEDLVFKVQLALQKAMKKRGISQKQLARRLGVSESWVSQIFSDSSHNITLATIAKLELAIGKKIVFDDCKETAEVQREDPKFYIVGNVSIPKHNHWIEKAANHNEVPEKRARKHG